MALSAAEYGRRAHGPLAGQRANNSIYAQGSADFNPLYLQLGAAATPEGPATPSRATGPRPLEWKVPNARSAGGAASAPQYDVSNYQMSSTWSPNSYPADMQQQVPVGGASGQRSNLVQATAALAAAAAGRTPVLQPYIPMAAAGQGTADADAGGIDGFPGLGGNSRPMPHKRAPAAAAVIDSATAVAASMPLGFPGVVLGPEIAGYKSVVTKNAVSPSGYSLAVQQPAAQPGPFPAAAAAAAAGRERGGSIGISGPRSQAPAAAAAAAATEPTYLALRPALDATSASSSRNAASGSSAAAAAAAALATLSGGSRGKRATNPATAAAAVAAAAGAAPSSRYSTCTVPEFSTADTAAVAGLEPGGGAPSALNWKVQARVPAAAAAAAAAVGANRLTPGPVAGRRATPPAAAAAAQRPALQAAAFETGYVPSSISSSAAAAAAAARPPSEEADDGSGFGKRPPSQEMSKGLSKLKQLSTARLASRLTTPPTDDVFVNSASMGASSSSASSRGRGGVTNSAGSADGAASGRSSSGRDGRGTGDAGWQQQQQQRPQQDWGSSNNAYNPSSYSSSSSTKPQGAAFSEGSSSSRSTSSYSRQRSAGSNPSRGGTGGLQAKGPIYEASTGQMLMSSLDGVDADGSSMQLGPGDQCLQQCSSCGRSFVQAALERHMRICDKVFGQKRKVFNTQSQRLQGSEAAKYTAKAAPQGRAASASKGSSSSSSSWQRQRPPQQQQQPALGRPASMNSRQQQQQQQQQQQLDNRPAVSAAAAKKSKWQQQSAQLRAAMGANKPSGSGGGYGGASSYQPPEPVEDNRIPCPHCGRRFAELAAERHIPKCNEIVAKPSGLKAGGGKGAYMRSNSRR